MPRGSYTVVENGSRHCLMCGERKAVTEFYRYRYKTAQGKDSFRYDGRCTPCNRQRRRDAWAVDTETKREKARAYKRKNREAINRQMREKRLSDIDAYRTAKRTYQMARKHKLPKGERGEQIALTRVVLEEARVGDKYIDAYDGCLIDDPEIDHIVPLSAGGKHEYDNLCVTSKVNNSRKHASTMLYWLATRAGD